MQARLYSYLMSLGREMSFVTRSNQDVLMLLFVVAAFRQYKRFGVKNNKSRLPRSSHESIYDVADPMLRDSKKLSTNPLDAFGNGEFRVRKLARDVFLFWKLGQASSTTEVFHSPEFFYIGKYRI